jgi:hypothetical protein
MVHLRVVEGGRDDRPTMEEPLLSLDATVTAVDDEEAEAIRLRVDVRDDRPTAADVILGGGTITMSDLARRTPPPPYVPRGDGWPDMRHEMPPVPPVPPMPELPRWVRVALAVVAGGMIAAGALALVWAAVEIGALLAEVAG